MATLGFTSIKLGIMDETEKVTKVFTIDKKEGGAIDAKVSGLAPETTKLYASNTAFYVSAVGTGDTKCDLTVADLSDDMLVAVLGALKEAGIIKIGEKTISPYVSVILESNGLSGDSIYIGLTKGKFTSDGDELKTNEGKGGEPNTDALAGSFISRGSDGYVYAKGRTGDEDFKYEDFEKFMFPGYTAPVTP